MGSPNHKNFQINLKFLAVPLARRKNYFSRFSSNIGGSPFWALLGKSQKLFSPTSFCCWSSSLFLLTLVSAHSCFALTEGFSSRSASRHSWIIDVIHGAEGSAHWTSNQQTTLKSACCPHPNMNRPWKASVALQIAHIFIERDQRENVNLRFESEGPGYRYWTQVEPKAWRSD